MKEIRTIQGAWSDEAHGWVSEILHLTGDAWLEVDLPGRGRVVIKKAESPEGPWPKAMITKWTGPEFRVRIYGSDKGKYLKIITTEKPKRIEYANI